MATTTAPPSLDVQRELAAGRRRRRRNETLLALLFVFPATLITFVFGIWPVIFGFFVSLHQWRARTHNFLGLDQYVRALGSTAYVLALLLCALFLYGALRAWRQARAEMQAGKGSFYPFLLPGAGVAAGAIALAAGLVAQIGELTLSGIALLIIGGGALWRVYNRPDTPDAKDKRGEDRGQPQTQTHLDVHGKTNYSLWSVQIGALVLLAVALFVFTVGEFLNDSALPATIIAAQFPDLYLPPLSEQVAVSGLGLLAVVGIAVIRWARQQYADTLEVKSGISGLLGALSIVLWVVIGAVVVYYIVAIGYDNEAANAARGLDRNTVEQAGMTITGLERSDYRSQYGSLNGETIANTLVAWPQVVLVCAGLLLVVAAYRVWQQVSRRETGLGGGVFFLLAILLAAGGWLLIGELPQAMAAGDPDYYQSLSVTVAYAVGTIPFQLGLGLLLAYLLFYEIHIGRSLYRMVYFMPYVAPTVATATVFVIIFSRRDTSLANQAIGLLNIPPQAWLSESRGVFEIIANLISGPGAQLPEFLAGPSLALVAIIIFNIWVFSGYNAVIFLAGLGAIPAELYEAAKVDGAGRWAAFRKITLPLLSPTTFMLTVLSTIGTFQAFNHIYVLRRSEAQGTADTATVHIFVQFWQYNQWGNASAMAFILFGIILVLTLVQNEVSKERVFYG